MAQETKDNKILVEDSDAQAAIMAGAKASYDAVTRTFGPKGKNVLIEKPFGRPMLTRDGVTVAREVYFKARAKNTGAQLVLEASELTNQLAGDGTTASVALTYELLKHGQQAIAAGMHPMDVKEQLLNDSYVILDKLEKLVKPTKQSQLKQVATVSSGNPLIGELIADALIHVGEDGGINTERASVSDVEVEYIDAYYLQTGFEALQSGKKELIDPFVVVTSKRLSSSSDTAEILGRVMQFNEMQPGQIPRILLIGNIEDAAYRHVVDLVNGGMIDAVVIKTPPQFGMMADQLLEDIAIYANCRVFGESDNIRDFSEYNVGKIDKVIARQHESTLFAENKTEAIETRVQELKDRMETEISDHVNEKIRDRISKLQGKIVLFKVGGASDTEKEEKEFRVEDAIQATRAAYKHGVVPGGGITLLELSKCDISLLYQKALRDVFSKLLSNADLSVDRKLDEALSAPKGYGFNLRESGDLVDMVKNGILDPKLVIEQVIKNATSVAAEALTTDLIIIMEDKEV